MALVGLLSYAEIPRSPSAKPSIARESTFAVVRMDRSRIKKSIALSRVHVENRQGTYAMLDPMIARKGFLLGGIVVIAAVFLAWYVFPATVENAGNQERITVRWLIAHEPSDLFARGAEEFARILAEESGGEMELKLLTPKDMNVELVGVGDIPPSTVFELLEKGEVEMSTVLATGVAKKVPEILEVKLPFRFEDADDAFSVLYGEGGARLLERISEKTDMRALAFTLSGGFRVFVSREPLQVSSSGGISGKTIITTAGEMGEKTLAQLGAQPLPTPNDINDIPDTSDIDALEAAYTRLSAVKNPTFVKHIAETNHSLFFTTILVRDSFYDALSPKNQVALTKAARAAGAIEWDDSIELGEKTKRTLQEKGVVIDEISPELRRALRSQVQPVYDWFYATYGSLLSPQN